MGTRRHRLPRGVAPGREAGILCPMLSEEFGGAGADFGYSAIVIEEIARTNCTGPGFPLHSDIVVPYIEDLATPRAQARMAAEDGGRRDHRRHRHDRAGHGQRPKAMRTTAKRDGDHYVINGSKTFISNGQSRDLVILCAKTDPAAGPQGHQPDLRPRRHARASPKAQPREDRPACAGHLGAVLRGCAGARREPAGRGEQGLLLLIPQPAAENAW